MKESLLPLRSRRRSAVLRACVVLLLLPMLLAACPEPEDPTDAWKECIEFAIEDAKDAYEACKDRSEDILDACLDAASNTTEENQCKKAHAARVEQCAARAQQVEQQKRDFCTQYFNDHKDDWSQGTNKQRAEIKKGAIDGLKALAEAALKLVTFLADGKISNRAEQQAVKNQSLALTPQNATYDIRAMGVGPDQPDPLQAVTIPFTLAPNMALNQITVEITGTQTVSLTGQIALLFTPTPSQFPIFAVDVLNAQLLAGSLDMGAVSTGPQTMMARPNMPGQGTWNAATGQMQLHLPLMVQHDFMSPDLLFLELNLAGAMTPGPGNTSMLQLQQTGPLESTFGPADPAPPLAAQAIIGPQGGTIALDGETFLLIPPGALQAPTPVSLAYSPYELLPDRCTVAGDPETPRCIAVAFDVQTGGQLLALPAFLSIGYNEGLLAGVDMVGLDNYRYDEGSQSWIAQVTPSNSHSPANEVFSFMIDMPGLYGLAGPQDPDTDSDGDGLIDWDEVYLYSTDPLNPDTDGDGIDDFVEVQIGTDPIDPLDPACATYDVNDDGITDVMDIAQVAMRWNDPAHYDVKYDVEPFGEPDGLIDIRDIGKVTGYFNTTCP